MSWTLAAHQERIYPAGHIPRSDCLLNSFRLVSGLIVETQSNKLQYILQKYR